MKKCQYCEKACIRKGMRDGVQVFRCKTCGRYQREGYRYKAHVPRVNERIAIYVKEGLGIRSIARVLAVSPTTVIARIKNIATAIVPPRLKEGRNYEMDEMATYSGNKANRVCVAYALDHKSREVAGLVVGRRNKANLGRLIDRLVRVKAKRITTDGLDLYRYLVPPAIHRVKGFGINRVERNNLTLRTRLRRLTRRTLCYTKNVAMLHACVTIACWG